MAGRSEGRPGDVEPVGGCQELVGHGMGLQKRNQAVELGGVFRADVGSLTEQVLRVADATHLAVVGLVAVARVDDDGSHLAACWFQQILAAVFQVKQYLRRWQVIGVLPQVEELRQHKVRRESDVIELCVFH